MSLPMRRLRSVLYSRVTLWVYAVLGVLVALAELRVLPSVALLVGAPAIAVALLVDTFLYNELSLRTGEWIWVGIYALLYVEAVAVGAIVRLLQPDWTERVVPEN